MLKNSKLQVGCAMQIRVFNQYINVTKKFILKGLITTAENDILLYFLGYFSEIIPDGISCELSA